MINLENLVSRKDFFNCLICNDCHIKMENKFDDRAGSTFYNVLQCPKCGAEVVLGEE